MRYEKSCGAVIYKIEKDEILYLLILNRKGNTEGHWGFPKGHVEYGESEAETAKREILEEVGLNVEIDEKFRYVVNYSPRPNVNKDAVYFSVKVSQSNITLQKSEVADMKWCNFDDAMNVLTHDKSLLIKANEYIKTQL